MPHLAGGGITIEGRMTGGPTRGKRRVQMVHDTSKHDDHVAPKRAAEEGERWILGGGEGVSKYVTPQASI